MSDTARLSRLVDSVTRQWELRSELTAAWPNAAPLLTNLASRIDALEFSHENDPPRGASAGEMTSVTECERVLHALLDALERYDDGERQSREDIERLLSRVDQLEKDVDVVLKEHGRSAVPGEESPGRRG